MHFLIPFFIGMVACAAIIFTIFRTRLSGELERMRIEILADTVKLKETLEELFELVEDVQNVLGLPLKVTPSYQRPEGLFSDTEEDDSP